VAFDSVEEANSSADGHFLLSDYYAVSMETAYILHVMDT
jgi:hypothetical protein